MYIAEQALFGSIEGQGWELSLLGPASGHIVAKFRTIEDVVEPVHTIAFAPRGRRFLTTGFDGCVRLYNLTSRQRLARFNTQASPAKSSVAQPSPTRP